MTAVRDTSWIKRSYPHLAQAPLSSARVLDPCLPNDTFLSAALAPFGKAALDKAS